MSPLKTILQLQNIKNCSFRKQLLQLGIFKGIAKKLIIGLKILQETSDHLNDTLTYEQPPKKG